MELYPQLDIVGGAASRRLICLLAFLFFHATPALPQAASPATDRKSQITKLYGAGHWNEVIGAVPESSNEDPDLELYRGLALAHLQRWPEAAQTFEAGLAGHPRDARFLTELAGIAYREKQLSRAKRELRRALAINPHDDYANDFLASIHYLEGNIEAALKYWNRTGKPKLADLTFNPRPRLSPLILDRTFLFSPGAEWRLDRFLTTQAQLKSLDVFPSLHFDLDARADGTFDLKYDAAERNAWPALQWEGIVTILRGLPYETVFPEFYDLDRHGLNWTSLLRWDDQKRRIFTEVAAPLEDDPKIHYRFYFDARDENWNITNTIASSIPSPTAFNLEKAAAGAEIQFIPSGLWHWKAGVEYSYRQFRDLQNIPAPAARFFTSGSALAIRSSVHRSLIRFPERRFTLDSSANAEFGKFFNSSVGQYGRIAASLSEDWFPQASGDDYQMQTELRAGRTFGFVPFDELFQLGFERDNDLWLRGHPGLRDGEKGNAPLGRNYILENWELDKIVYKGAFFTVKAGPILDSGKIYDPSGYFGARRWQWDTGVQTKIRILGSFEFILGYGKNLRSGTNSLFTTVTH
jgi:tetratricopeptide (TPR) repeat protein